MTGGPIPIRAGIEPQFDAAREMLDYCRAQITDFTKEVGSPPTCIALVLAADHDGERHTAGYSWDSSEQRTNMEICSTASTILLKRAMR